MRNPRILLLPFLTAAAAGCAKAGTPAIGSSAPGFSLPAADGSSTVKLQEETARHPLTVVMFIATRCPYSNGYNERMEGLESGELVAGTRRGMRTRRVLTGRRCRGSSSFRPRG
jgi:hypothetical protein